MKTKLTTFFMFLISFQSLAAFSCNVDISTVLIYSDGSVNVLHTGRGDYTYICNLQSERQGVSVTTCAMWTSMLQNVQSDASKATFYFAGTGSCSTMATYGSAPVPVYIGTI